MLKVFIKTLLAAAIFIIVFLPVMGSFMGLKQHPHSRVILEKPVAHITDADHHDYSWSLIKNRQLSIPRAPIKIKYIQQVVLLFALYCASLSAIILNRCFSYPSGQLRPFSVYQTYLFYKKLLI